MQRRDAADTHSASGGRRALRQQDQRQRRAQRELQQALRERAERAALPRNDVGPLPRID